MTNTQIPEQEKTEFPGLEQIAIKLFDLSYHNLTPNLKQHVRSKAAEAAAGDMLAALKEAWEPWRTLLNEGKIGLGGYPASLEKAAAAIAKAEGR